jgi:DNA-binding beta-propeller fold protein YncE
VAAAAATLFLFATPASGASTSSYNFDFNFGAGQLSRPQGVAVDPSDGEVFVADTGNNRIEVFDANGVFERQFGSLGTGAGQLTSPAGVGVSPVAPFDVYVADTSDNRIERFTNAGAFVSAFAGAGGGAGQVDAPRYIAFDDQGNVFVGDTGLNQRVSEWTADGAFVGVVAGFQRLGGLASAPGAPSQLYATDSQQDTLTGLMPPAGFQTGVLDDPQGVAAETGTSGTVVFVADAGNHRVAAFGGDGPLLRTFGTLGTGEGQFEDPSGIAFSPLNAHVYVAESNDCCTRISAWKQIPDPVLGQSMDIQTDKGTVSFKPPGATKFTTLTKVTLVRSGTIIDARHGTVGITSLTASGQLQSADFYSGVFRAVQDAKGKGLTDAQLFGGDFTACPAGLRAASHAPQTIRKLWGSGAGQFRTKGRFAAASIRGTTWLTDDRCDGTLIRVTQGSVSVRDLATNQTVVVRSGHQYFARARGSRPRGR